MAISQRTGDGGAGITANLDFRRSLVREGFFVDVAASCGVFRTDVRLTRLGGVKMGFGNMPQWKFFNFINVFSCRLVRVTGKEGQ